MKKPLKCLRCLHTWTPKKSPANGPPHVCPRCHSPYYNTPRRITAGQLDKIAARLEAEKSEFLAMPMPIPLEIDTGAATIPVEIPAQSILDILKEAQP